MTKSNNTILPTAFFGNTQYYSILLNSPEVIIEHFDYFEKQHIRNNCDILTANGILKLSVPLVNRQNKSITNEIEISYAENWIAKHCRSIESAYNNSPYFEFYWDDYLKILNTKHNLLIDLNTAILKTSLKHLKSKKEICYSNSYVDVDETFLDLRLKKSFATESTSLKPYQQVFTEKFGFSKNLSILDLVFNCGPESAAKLKT